MSDKMMKGAYTGAVLAGKSAPLLDFRKADYEKALQSNKTILLYFFANWCPICRAELPHLYAAFNELNTDKVIGFRVNYNDPETDTDELALAQQFQVPYQHSKVFIKNGKQIGKFPDGWDKTRYLIEISKVIE
jgi:thiol-disulfide isomerase/thioredoxin